MLTTADIVGRSAGDGLVHNRATLMILTAASLLKLDPNFGSTNSSKFPFCCKTRAYIRMEKKMEKETNQHYNANIFELSLLLLSILSKINTNLR
jgi:hypothetical protein